MKKPLSEYSGKGAQRAALTCLGRPQCGQRLLDVKNETVLITKASGVSGLISVIHISANALELRGPAEVSPVSTDTTGHLSPGGHQGEIG
jgi:hypothetical protein